MAIWARDDRLDGLVHHSDRRQPVHRDPVHTRRRRRRSSVGSYDNAVAESTIGQIKTELIHHRGPWRTVAALAFALFEYLPWWNHRRLHSEIGGIPPAEKEALYYAQHPTPAGAGTQ